MTVSALGARHMRPVRSHDEAIRLMAWVADRAAQTATMRISPRRPSRARRGPTDTVSAPSRVTEPVIDDAAMKQWLASL